MCIVFDTRNSIPTTAKRKSQLLCRKSWNKEASSKNANRDRQLTSQGSGFSCKELYEALEVKLGNTGCPLWINAAVGHEIMRSRTQPTDSTEQCRESIMMHHFILQFSDLSIKNVFSNMNQVKMDREDGFPEQKRPRQRLGWGMS